jgi:hypothetical protein
MLDEILVRKSLVKNIRDSIPNYNSKERYSIAKS